MEQGQAPNARRPPQGSVSQVRLSLRQDLAREFEVASELNVFSDKTLLGNSIPEASIAQQLVLVEAGRSAKTYEAILHLCMLGYGEQALMLARSLFESMAVAFWITQHPTEAEVLHQKHREFTRRLSYEAHLKHGMVWDVAPAKEPSSEERGEFARLFGRHGTKPWTGHRALRDLIADIEPLFGDDLNRAQLWVIADVILPDLNWTMHSSSAAVAGSMIVLKDLKGVDIGPSPFNVGNGLLCGVWTYSRTLERVIEYYGWPGMEELKLLGKKVWRAWEDPDVLRRIGRNDLCPCGSGVKYKRCHGE